MALSFFFALWSLSLWGLVWHFAASEMMIGGFGDLPDNLDLVVGDAQLYLGNVDAQLDHWSGVNFDRELSDGFDSAVEETARGMNRALDEVNEPQYTGMTRITGLPPFLIRQCLVGVLQSGLLSPISVWPPLASLPILYTIGV